MSQITGGRADKFGNAFERLWIVNLALDVVDGRATSLKWEALGPEGAGVECEVARPNGASPNGVREKHQCKIENGSHGKWSAADLGAVIVAAKNQLEADPLSQFVFVSKDPARVPSDLADRARSCDNNAKDFLTYCLTSVDHRRNYQNLCERWGLNSKDEADAQVAIGLLSRMQFERGFWEPNDKRMLYRYAESIAEGDGKEIVHFLGTHLEERLGNTLRSDEIRTTLRERGLPPINLTGSLRVPEGIERLQNRFQSSMQPQLIRNQVLSRPEPEKLVELMFADREARLIFVTGDAGSGKSGVLLDAMRLLDEQELPYLPIRLDMHCPDRAVHAYSKECLELPASPGACLRTLADGRRAVLIIDQLDAVRWTSANSDRGWELCKEIIDEALQSPNVTVVVAGRTVDLEDDPRIENWKKGKQAGLKVHVETLHVKRMPEDVIRSLVESYDVSYASLLPKEKDLLSNAQCLQLWWQLAEDGKLGTFSSRAALLRSYWEHYRDKAVREFPNITHDMLNALLDEIVNFMDTHGRLDAPKVLLERHRPAAIALRGLSILDYTNETTRFSHQSHLDYLTIENIFMRTLRGDVTPIKWLRGHGQSLFRRDQVRFLLQLLRGQHPTLYMGFLQDIFFCEGVRFHIQHLALTTLAQADPPTDEEHEFIKRLWREEPWHVHVLERVLARHVLWLDRFTGDGTIPAMLASKDEIQREEALLLCSRSAEAAPEWFEHVLTPHWDAGDSAWAEIIGRLLANDAKRDTPLVFEWRLACARDGADRSDIYTAEQLAAKHPTRAIAYLAAIAVGLITNVVRAAAGGSQRYLEVDSERFKNLRGACEAHPRIAWDALLPVRARAVTVEEKICAGQFSIATYQVKDGMTNLISLLDDFLTASGSVLLTSDNAVFLMELKKLGQVPTTAHARKLAVDVLGTAPESLADDALTCFLGIYTPMDIDVSSETMKYTDRLSPQDPALCVLSRMAGSSSSVTFQCIESEVLAFHASYEKQDVKWQLGLIREGNWHGHPNLFGLSQYALLLALPEDRLSDEGTRALRMWRGKFGKISKYRDNNTMGILPVVSPIPLGKAKYVSDRVWIDIVKGDWSRRRKEWRNPKDGSYIEASPRTFASSLEEAGKVNPRRYIRLAYRFPANADECYCLALLRVAGVEAPPNDTDKSWTPASVADIEVLIAHFHNKEDAEIAKNICRVVRDRCGESWSNVTLDLLFDYSLHHADPEGCSLPNSTESQGDVRSVEMLLHNSVRCSAISAASQLLWAHSDLLNWAKDLAEHAIQDPHPAVRAASFELAYSIGRYDLDLALSLMVRAYEDTDDAILSVQQGCHLIQYLWRRETELAPVFERALSSHNQRTSELAAYWITIGSILNNIYTNMASRAGDGTAALVGIVRALVDVAVHNEQHRIDCLDRLCEFLEAEDQKVLRATVQIICRDGFFCWPKAPEFAERLIRSTAFIRDPIFLLHHLAEFEGSLVPYAQAIMEVVTQLSGPLGSTTQYVTNRHGIGHYMATILLRLYQQSEGQENLRSLCLDQWDTLLQARVGTAEDVISKIDS